MADTIFSKVIARELPATIRYEDDNFIAFDDIFPKAPIHVLVVTKHPYATLEEIAIENTDLQARLLVTARKVARQLGIESNYKLIMNVGLQMQAVPHLHVHVLGGWKEKTTPQPPTVTM